MAPAVVLVEDVGVALEPCNSFAAVPIASYPRPGVDTGCAAGLARAAMHGPDRFQQCRVRSGREGRRTMPPGEETRLGHAGHAGRGGDREAGLLGMMTPFAEAFELSGNPVQFQYAHPVENVWACLCGKQNKQRRICDLRSYLRRASTACCKNRPHYTTW